jgi:2-oxoglutarate ferredoxin oxidoreductase subunit delta
LKKVIILLGKGNFEKCFNKIIKKMAKKGDVVIAMELCKGCGVCITGCPKGVLALGKEVNNKGYKHLAKVNDECIGCANCAVLCPDGVLTVYRQK